MDTLNGFEVFDDFMPGALKSNNTIPGKEEDSKIDQDSVSEELSDEELEKLKGSKSKQETESEEDNVEEPIKKSTKKEKEVEPESEEVEEEVEEEDNAVSAFFGVLSDKMGWVLDDDEQIPTTPEELVQYFQDVIEENSVPRYSSKEVEDLDNFVRNGGNLRDYLQIDADIDWDNIKLEDDEGNQKLVLKEFMKEKGFNSKQIEKKLAKYEDAGLLEDEAEDALEALKDIKAEKKQQLLAEQQKAAERARKAQQDYFNSVVNEIKGLDSIRGIKVPEKEKRELLEYIFKPESDGLTKFNKDWSKSVKNLIETAYFTKNGDALIKAAKIEGSNEAINKFKNSLNRTGVSRKTKVQNTTSSESMWDSFARQLRVN